MKKIGTLLVILGGGFIIALIVAQLVAGGIYMIFGCSGESITEEIVCPGSVGKDIGSFIELLTGGTFLLSLVVGPIALLVAVVGLFLRGVERLRKSVVVSQESIPLVPEKKPKKIFYKIFKWIIIAVIGYYLLLLTRSFI